MDDLRKNNTPQENGECTDSSSQDSDSDTGRKNLNPGFDRARQLLFDAEGLQEILQGLTNMALAHEIAVNKDFKLERPGPNDLSPHFRNVLTAKDKYWEKVDEILASKSIKECKPIILELMHHLKSMLLGTMLPHNKKIREKVEDELNMIKVSVQIDNDAFDFVHYMDFILDSLAALCCPIRDQEIVEIRSIELPSKQVRKAIELMENMNLDMANFIISQSRGHIIQNCVTYERNKFASFVDLQYRMSHDPIYATREWILRHTTPERSFNETMGYAFLEALEWSHSEWPETLTLDSKRFPPINNEIVRIILVGSICSGLMEYTRSLIQSSPTIEVNQGTSLAQKLLKLLTRIVNEVNVLVAPEEVPDSKKLEEALERISIQAIKIVDEFSVNEYSLELSPVQEKEIKNQILAMGDKNHPVRQLYSRRVRDWIVLLGEDEPKDVPVPPQNLSFIGQLVAQPVTEFIRFVHFNRKIFDIVYLEIYEGNCPPPASYPPICADDEIDMDDTILNLLTKLQGLPDKSKVSRKPLVRPVSPAGGLVSPLEFLLNSIPGSRKDSNKSD